MAQSGKLGDAEARCRYVLEKQPDNDKAVHLLGVIALNSGRAGDAVPLFERAVELNARIPDFHTNLGVAYMSTGRDAEGIACFRKAVALHSGHGDGHFNLGLALLKSEGPAAARENLQTAARLMPKNARVQMNFGLVLSELEGAATGLRFLEKAADLSPRDPLVLFNLGSAYLNTGRPDDALARFDEAVAIAPKAADIHFGRARVLARLGRNGQAARGYIQAIKLNDRFALAHSNLAQLLVYRGDLDLAEQHIRKAIALRPDDEELHLNLATTLAASGKTHPAVTVCQGIEQRHPEFAAAYSKHASILQSAGDYEGAREVIDILRHVDPDPVRILPLLATDRTAEVDEATVQQVVASLDAGTLPDSEVDTTCFALGRILERQEKYEEAFSFYRRGNRIRSGSQPYDAERHRQHFERLKAAFDAATLEAHAKDGVADDRPIFILGMPRSGTSLVEQILGSHRGVGAAGELTEYDLLSQELPEMLRCEEGYPECIRHLDAPKLQDLGRAYMVRQTKRFADAHKITDKMPANFLHLGLIAMTLPGARIIHCRRNPLDTCCSIYSTNFQGRHPYSHDLVDLGHYYAEYVGLMEHWTRHLPLPILHVDYEALVADAEGSTREMLDFCGLKWDEDCLRFFESRRIVHTESHWQVRQPIYSTSVGRWRRFEPHLEPLRETLRGHGIDPEGGSVGHES